MGYDMWSRDIIYKYAKIKAWRGHAIGFKS